MLDWMDEVIFSTNSYCIQVFIIVQMCLVPYSMILTTAKMQIKVYPTVFECIHHQLKALSVHRSLSAEILNPAAICCNKYSQKNNNK